MNDQPNPPSDESSDPQSVGDAGQFTQRIRHQQVSARVPEDVARGTFATGALVMQGPHEFIIDFIQTVTRPHQVSSRVILPTSILARMVEALKQNLDTYSTRFGAPQELPKPPQPQKPPSVEEIYEHLKLADEIASGTYANTVMITHAPAEFCFDFITSFYPRSAVACRVFMSAQQVPRLLQSLNQSLEQFKRRIADAQRQQQSGQQTPPPGPGTGIRPQNPGEPPSPPPPDASQS